MAASDGDVVWSGYEVHELSKAFDELTPSEARSLFARLMDGRSERAEMIARFARANGLRWSGKEEDLQPLNDLFIEGVDFYADSGLPTYSWVSIAWDVALLVGDFAIARDPHLKWAIGRGGKRMQGFQSPVIVGHPGAVPGYQAAPFILLQRYVAHCAVVKWDPITARSAPRPDMFVRAIDGVVKSVQPNKMD
ncbi:hypothetical protein [Pseudolysinimonas yzui]|uniref:hypothetical protein n=1 Tax=Pseudolysinimonas yzui TaxID=2708254 RepID=UPI001749FADC|nr:hypothetical protein [Pseudolysinimonas yzui]